MSDNDLLDDTVVVSSVEKQPNYLDQEHANKIAQASYARGRKAAEGDLAKKIEELESLIKNSRQAPAIDEEEILNRAEERAAERARRDAEASKEAEIGQKLVDKFNQKIQKGSESFEDFGDKVKKFNPKVYPHLAVAIAEADDGEEILYSLLDRGIKISQINKLLKDDAKAGIKDGFGKDELNKISNDIKKNNAIKSGLKKTSAPLSKVNPSSSGLGKDGNLTVEHFKARGMYRF